MKVVILDRSTLGSDMDLSVLNQFGELVCYDYTNEEETIARLKDCDIAITNKVLITKEVIDATELKLICISATGMNNVDVEYAKHKGIEVKNVAGYSTSSVAQLTISFALNFIQKMDYYSSYVKDGNWHKSKIFTHIDNPFMELDGKTWGVIGLGNIGEKVAQIASAFGCNIKYYSTSGMNYNANYDATNLTTLISESDIISIHSPLNEKTKDLLNYENMKLLKNDAIVINVARGGIINEYDIVKILKEKNIYFAIDTVTTEPIEEDSPLNEVLENDNVIITPHIAWSSIESRKKLIEGIYNNIKGFIDE
ncbi:D-2-hydroxyacid dehydrogenase [Arcobacter sp. F2176]|uniref:D-2-hydroxyacid dehydrogenase n=1 Tax=unclassified Arcobacter TaxID=2593671 RepID=UPI00100A9C90|nr:D-2-hydroxyacid dehydrogenase [Arcobacter sp. F2176]RXJ81483.1 hydroxyacid dehydrogenase [Arcobacter sp. F2176]